MPPDAAMRRESNRPRKTAKAIFVDEPRISLDLTRQQRPSSATDCRSPSGGKISVGASGRSPRSVARRARAEVEQSKQLFMRQP